MPEQSLYEPCRIIGVLDNGTAGLTTVALAHLQSADLLIGAGRTLSLFGSCTHAERRDMGGQLSSVPEWIAAARDAGRRVVVLATGDPLCHGIASYLISRLGMDACEILPNASTLQWAFARLHLAWSDAKICSVHSKDAGEWSCGATPEHGLYALMQAARCHDLLAVFTSPENTPARIARMLVSEGLGDTFTMSIVTRIFQTQENASAEKIVAAKPVAQCVDLLCEDPNIVILQRCKARATEVLFGLDDSEFLQRKPDKGLITKREVRAVSLARMQLHRDSIVWDVGAGSGSVGLEAARLCPDGHVYAIEKNSEDAIIALQNRQRLGITNYTLVNAKAPVGMDSWPAPDAMFVGGSGGELDELIRLGLQRLKADGWLIMNFVTFENLGAALATLGALGAVWDVTQLQASRSQPILHMHRLQAENPVWIVSAQRALV
jgi:precorrin-6B C5,15-methyltransferase / cobalt-precorrin-6B C5,C15-methyltransferase